MSRTLVHPLGNKTHHPSGDDGDIAKSAEVGLFAIH